MKPKPQDLKLIVQDKYGQIAKGQKSCCGGDTCCSSVDYSIFSDDYSGQQGYNKDADLGLGCGLPTEFAGIKEGDHVLDLGSGAGNDCFVARTQTGDAGKVTGLDFTEAMIKKANKNLEKTGFKNIEFIQGDIEEMPLPDASFDVVISNCVLNLVPDKQKAFSEIFRVLKPGGHFSISDVVIVGNLPEGLKKDAEMYAGCVSGAIDKNEYISIVEQQGFSNIAVQKEKEIVLSDETLLNHISPEELEEFKQSGNGIFSITLFAEKMG
ncbi:arsenite methyltransferase [Anaerophaga thermohalophila]|uniref:arsenite methyltransferase n=1 Tax=Anaerophaga thermohalophila TaxID=177400 RepID=UPI000237C09D|nr:arsenite methyltransferase [Anaerophaga thermohalophila]MDI3521516.1 arsenite methyltransferase [Anaerophaga sp.]